MRSIDADELKKIIISPCKDCKVKSHFCSDCPVTNFVEFIDNAPTVETPCNDCCADTYRDGYEKGKADARPKGEWLPNYTSQFMNPGRQCSLCGKIVEFSENYCPKCGAFMRGKNNG